MDVLISKSLLVEFFNGEFSSHKFLGDAMFKIESQNHFRLIASKNQLEHTRRAINEVRIRYFDAWLKSAFQNGSIIIIDSSFEINDMFNSWKKKQSQKYKRPMIVILSDRKELNKGYDFVIARSDGDKYAPPEFSWVLRQLLCSKVSSCSYLSYDIDSIDDVIKSINKILAFQSSINKIDFVQLISRHSNFDDNSIFKAFKHSRVKKVLYYKTKKLSNHIDIDPAENKSILEFFEEVEIYNEKNAFMQGHCFHDRLIVFGPVIIECTNNFENIRPDSDVWRIIIDYDVQLAEKRTRKFSENNFNLVS